MIRVLVVDDSSFMRTALSMMLERSPDIEVVGKARDGQEALDLMESLDPDVLTMDIEMPRMDGLTALRHIMQRSPRPVLMISSLTQEGAAATVEALSIGAVDFIPKEHARVQLSITQIEGELHQKIKAAALARPRLGGLAGTRRPTLSPSSTRKIAAATPPPVESRRPAAGAVSPASRPTTPLPRRPKSSHGRAEVLVIGVSTGGPFALQEVIPALPASFSVPVVVVQHMPPHFTRSLAARLDGQSALEVREAEQGMALQPGRVIIAQGGTHLRLSRGPDGTARTVLSNSPEDLLHRPSVDVLFRSASEVYGRKTLALIMTGMGKDGLEGAKHIRARGGGVLAQDEKSCVVYGMPRAVVEAGVAEAVLPLDGIAGALGRLFATRPHLAHGVH